MTTSKFLLKWDSAFYDDTPDAIKNLDFFTEDWGYDEDDINQVRSLEIGQTTILDGGAHTVTRLS